jgi:hypothetical protein
MRYNGRMPRRALPIALLSCFVLLLAVLAFFSIPSPYETPSAQKEEVEQSVSNNKKNEPELVTGETPKNVVTKISQAVTDIKAKTVPAVVPPIPSTEEINEKSRTALVNVYCETQSGGTTRLVTGSGVIIDPRGVILTNAHIAQNFLLENAPEIGSADCVIRTGSPASPSYEAKILYLSPSWIKENAASFKQEDPRGTGEHDFALLRITQSLRKDTPLPEQFPYLTPETDMKAVGKNRPVLLASYPAGFLGSIAIQKNLYQTSAVTRIKELFTFKESSIDAFSVGGSVVAQKGSSGSGVVSLDTGKLLGIVVTSTDGQTTAERDLQAITFSHMEESMKKDIGFSLEELLSGNIVEESDAFQQNVSPLLLELITKGS